MDFTGVGVMFPSKLNMDTHTYSAHNEISFLSSIFHNQCYYMFFLFRFSFVDVVDVTVPHSTFVFFFSPSFRVSHGCQTEP